MANQPVELKFQKRSRLLGAVTDSLIMIRRSTTHILRNTDQLLGTFFQPIMFLVLFSAVFGKSIEATLPPGTPYLNFLLAGILIQTLAFGSTTTSIAIANDLQKGIVDRFRSLPMSNLAVLNGHVISDLFRNGISTIVMIVVGFILGFRPNASFLDWLAIIGLLTLFTLAFSWLAAIVGVVAKSVEAVQWLSFIIVFPLTFASSAFVQAEYLSGPLRTFAENQPITQVIEAVRALMLGNPIGNHGWLALAWWTAILIIAVPVATWLFSKKSQ